jgi:tRNA threonylcarbamoyladenosine biosynthesis protein TsaE
MPTMKTWQVTSLEEMVLLAKELTATLITETKDQPVVLALHGNLGAGKTTLVQLIAKELGVTDTVTSPTFVIMKSYVSSTSLPTLVHIDAYRIEEIDEMRVLGFERLLTQKHTIICIEWAERIAKLLPENTLHLSITEENQIRTITLEP